MRADVQEPDQRHTVPDELATDNRVSPSGAERDSGFFALDFRPAEAPFLKSFSAYQESAAIPKEQFQTIALRVGEPKDVAAQRGRIKDGRARARKGLRSSCACRCGWLVRCRTSSGTAIS